MADATLAPLDLLRLAVAIAALWVVPGAAWHMVFWPRAADLGLTERLATVPLVSYLISSCAALALARVGLLGTWSLGIVLAAISVTGVVLSARRLRGSSPLRSWRPHWASLVAALVGVGLVTVVIVVPQVRLIMPEGMPVGSITWYYWGLAQQILGSGAIPTDSAEWGGMYPYQGDYIMYSAFSAGLGFLGGRTSEFVLMDALRIGSLVWAVVGAIGGLRRFLPMGGALVATLLFFSSVFVVGKYTGYRPESFHYALIFSALWAVDRFAERSTMRRAIPIVGIIVALWLGHGVVLVVAGLLGAAILVARWLLDGRVSVLQIVRAGAVLGVGFVVAVVADFLLQGSVILLANVADPGPIQGPTSSDLTWQFFQWALGGRLILSGDPAEVTTIFSENIEAPWRFAQSVSPWPAYLIALVPIATWRFLDAPARRLYIASLVYLVGLFVVVLGFLTLYDTYVPQRVGFGRLAPFTVVAASLIIAVAATGCVRVARRLVAAWSIRRAGTTHARLWPRATGAAIWTVALLAVVLAVGSSITRGTGNLNAARLSTDGLAALHWVRDNTPEDAVVLANAYTEGVIGVVAQRNGLLDGRAPYNKEFAFLLRSVDQLQIGRSFIAAETSVDELAALGVDVVITSPNQYDLANPTRFCQPAAEIDRTLPCFVPPVDGRHALRRVAEFGEISIFLIEATTASRPAAQGR